MRFFSIALLTAAIGSLSVSATQCSSLQFLWNKNKEICLPFGKPSTVSSPPSGKSCPTDEWYWHSQSSCCVPTKPKPSPPTCSKGEWDDNGQCCNSGSHTTPSWPAPTHGWGKGGNDGHNNNDWGHGKGGQGNRRRAAQKNRITRNSVLRK